VAYLYREKGGLDLAEIAILDLAHHAGFTLTDLKKHKIAAPAFSSTRWKDVAPNFGLDPSKDFHQLETFSFPVASLPLLFHRGVMKISAQC
jgi:hypothetical protein